MIAYKKTDSEIQSTFEWFSKGEGSGEGRDWYMKRDKQLYKICKDIQG